MQRRAALVWGVFGELVYKGSTFCAPLVFALVASKEGYAEFILLLTLYTTAWIFIDLGIGTYGTRKVARNESEIQTFVVDVTVVRAFFAIVCSSILITLLLRSEIEFVSSIWWAAFVLLKAVTTDWLTRGTKRFKVLSSCQLLQSVAFLLSIYFVVYEELYLGAPWAISAFVFFVSITAANTLKRENAGSKVNVAVKSWREFFYRKYYIISNSIFFTLSNGLSSLYQSLPLLLVPVFFGVAYVAEIGLVFRVVLAMVFVFSLPGLVLFPFFASAISAAAGEKSWKLVKNIYFGYLFSAVVIGIILFIAVVKAVQFFSPAALEVAQVEVMLYLWFPFAVLRSARTILVKYVNARGGERTYAKTMGVVLLGLIVPTLIFSQFEFQYFVQTMALAMILCELFISFRLFKSAKTIK